MCGLIGVVQRAPGATTSAQFAADQLERQISRGRQGFGIVGIGRDKTVTIVRATSAERVYAELAQFYHPIVLVHHRAPTSTPNKHNQTHPIVVSNTELKYDWLVMHNGIISNDDELHGKHLKLGYIYTTEGKHTESSRAGYNYAYQTQGFNDSEAFAIELARYLENKETRLEIGGSAAFIAVQVDKKTHLARTIAIGTNGRNPMTFDDFDGLDRIDFASELETGYDLTDTKESCPNFNSVFMDIDTLYSPGKKLTSAFDGMIRQAIDFHEPERRSSVIPVTTSGRKTNWDTHRYGHEYEWNGVAYVPKDKKADTCSVVGESKQVALITEPPGDGDESSENTPAYATFNEAVVKIADRLEDRIIEEVDAAVLGVKITDSDEEIMMYSELLTESVTNLIEKRFENIIKAKDAALVSSALQSNDVVPGVDKDEMEDYQNEINAYLQS